MANVIKALDFILTLIFLYGAYRAKRENRRVCVFMVGAVEKGVLVRTLNERFVLQNDDHIQLCENSSCSWLGKRGDSK